jgi:16S rRNA G1207 methylase RsmC
MNSESFSVQLIATGHEEQYLASWLELEKTRGDAEVLVASMNLKVQRGVFSPDPAATHSTSFMLECLPLLRGKSVLDLGCGCGVLSVNAFRQGASEVVAIDADASAVDNTKANLKAQMADQVAVRWPWKFGQGAKLFPLDRETGFYG